MNIVVAVKKRKLVSTFVLTFFLGWVLLSQGFLFHTTNVMESNSGLSKNFESKLVKDKEIFLEVQKKDNLKVDNTIDDSSDLGIQKIYFGVLDQKVKATDFDLKSDLESVSISASQDSIFISRWNDDENVDELLDALSNEFERNPSSKNEVLNAELGLFEKSAHE